MISPLRYSGGKSRLYKHIKEYFPKDKNIMIDLFFGGGSVGLNWLADNPNHELIANDLDNDLINFWKTVKNNVKYFNDNDILVYNENRCKLLFQDDPYLRVDSYSVLTFLVRNKCSYNGLHHNPKWSNQAFNENFNKSTFTRIKKCNELLQRSKIYNLDWIKFISLVYNSEKNWFIYLDPPYWISNATKLYKHGNFNHYELWQVLKKIKTSWVLSINDCQQIRELYKDFNIYEIETNYTSSNTGKNKVKKVKELVITNFKKGDLNYE